MIKKDVAIGNMVWFFEHMTDIEVADYYQENFIPKKFEILNICDGETILTKIF